MKMRSKLPTAQHKDGYFYVCDTSEEILLLFSTDTVFQSYYLSKFPLLLSYFHGLFPLLCNMLGSAFPNPSAALNPCRLCALANMPQ